MNKKIDEIISKIKLVYPPEKILYLSIDDYIYTDNKVSFCGLIQKIVNEYDYLKTISKSSYGIYKNSSGAIVLSNEYHRMFGNDYKNAFRYIKDTIYQSIVNKENKLYNKRKIRIINDGFIIVVLSIYCSSDFIPLNDEILLKKSCELLRIKYIRKSKKDIFRKIIASKNRNPEIEQLNNFDFVDYIFRYSDCDNELKKEIKSIDNLSVNSLTGKEKNSIVKVRINQNFFRDRLLLRYGQCCLCGIKNTKILVASHIKPWSKSKPDEKIDVDNGFLFCPSHDKLFDLGLISFSDKGTIIISDSILVKERSLLNISDKQCIELTNGNKKYLKYHRKNIFHK